MSNPMPASAMLSSFHDSIREPQAAHISPKRLSAELDMSLTSLSEVLQVHRNTFRNPKSESLQAKMRDIAGIVARASDLLGSQDKAVYWYRNQQIADYGGVTAEQLVTAGNIAAVTAYLDDIETGALG